MNEAPENGIEVEEDDKKSLHKDQRGAVLAEFVIVLLPMLTTFFVFAQLAAMASARLMLKHSAVVAARAASVYSNSGDNVPEASGADGRGDVQSAAQAALGTWNRSFTGVSVAVNDTSTRGDDDNQYDLVTVTVSATYRCQVPLGKIICGGGTRAMQDTKSMPHQGARYRTE